jgi:ATPase subunit of ABC transporter with duplicated ATPase domains
VQRARAHIALIDEPTNHMDYVAKQSFIKWFKSAREAIVVITHDRDVLQAVDRIIEVKDEQTVSFPVITMTICALMPLKPCRRSMNIP